MILLLFCLFEFEFESIGKGNLGLMLSKLQSFRVNVESFLVSFSNLA